MLIRNETQMTSLLLSPPDIEWLRTGATLSIIPMMMDPSSRGAAADQSGAAAAAWRQLTGSRDRAARVISEDLWREPAQLQMVYREMTLFRYLALLVFSRYIIAIAI